MNAEEVHRRLLIKKLEEGETPPAKRELSRAWFDKICGWCGTEFNFKDIRDTKSKSYCSAVCKESATKMSVITCNKAKHDTPGYREQHDRMTRSLLTGDERNRIRRLMALGDSFTIKEAGKCLCARSEAKVKQWIQQFEVIGILEATRVPFKAVKWAFTKHAEVERLRSAIDVPR